MTRKIPGRELRDRLLSRSQRPTDSEPTEEMRIEALSSPGNRELLEIIATHHPRSINELANLAHRLQPNVSRSLGVLDKAGLLTFTLDGRASVPTLTDTGRRKAEELGFIARAGDPPPATERSLSAEAPGVSATILGAAHGDLDSDAVEAQVTVRFPPNAGASPVVAQARLNLTEVCAGLLANWWRVLYRRADPYKLFALEKETDQGISHAIMLAKSTGRMELLARSLPDDAPLWGAPRLSLTADEFTILVLDKLVRPLVSRLRAGRLFDRPVESMLRRTEEIRDNTADHRFWKTAGALGLSYRTMSDAAAADIAALTDAISDEDARLDFASAIDPAQLRQSLAWAEHEITQKCKINGLARLVEVRRETSTVLPGVESGAEPWCIGKERAREARKQLGLAEDRPVGGMVGIARLFGGDENFAASAANEDVLRGFQGFSNGMPVIVVKDEGPRSTAFLMSRGVGDHLVYGSHAAPIADIYSERQAIGRAFAAEFMAPAEGVVHMIDKEQKSITTVANHYGVNREVVSHQYENSVAQYA